MAAFFVTGTGNVSDNYLLGLVFCFVVVQVSTDTYLIRLVLPCYGASVGWMSFCLACPPRHGFCAGWVRETGPLPRFAHLSLAEIFVAEPVLSNCIVFGKMVVRILVVVINQLLFCGLLETIVSFFSEFLRQRLQLRDILLVSKVPPKMLIKSECKCKLSFCYSLLRWYPDLRDTLLLRSRSRFICRSATMENHLLFCDGALVYCCYTQIPTILSSPLLAPWDEVFSGDAMCTPFSRFFLSGF